MKYLLRFLVVVLLWPIVDILQLIWDPLQWRVIWDEAKIDYPEAFRRKFRV